jgi:UDP-N-acetylmuramoyl-tripeptide--D-alanyl-D-alanine ligase
MAEKAALLQGLPDDGAAIVNADNYYCREIMEDVRCHLVTYGTWEDADVYGFEPRATPTGVGFLLYGRMPFEIPAMGLHNVPNALAAVAVGLWLGQDPSRVRDALSAYRAPPMRMSREVVDDVVLINDAYNANPRSMEAAILELSVRPCSGRRIAVLGEMLELGAETERHHRALGRKVANAGIDLLWAIGPSAEAMADEARRHGLGAAAVRAHATMGDALADPAFEPRPGDTWLFKASRGLALERLVETVRRLAGAPDEAGVGSVGRLSSSPPL